MEDPFSTLGLPPVGDEYGPTDAPRWSQPWSSGVVAALTALAAVAVGFLVTTGVAAGRSEAEVDDARKQVLIDVIRQRQERVEALAAQLEGLRSQVALIEAGSGAAGALSQAVERVERLAGLTPLRGPGVRVELADAEGVCRGSQPQDCRIQDADLQLVVNALFAAGAEGVAVSGERVISTTAIRGAGGAVLVNYRVLSAPYVVEAIGDAGALAARFAASGIARDFAAWSDTYGLGLSIQAVDETVLPAYGGALRVRHASPAGRSTVGLGVDP